MKTVLVVSEPFGQYQRGDVIEDPAAMDAVMASENANQVVRTQVPDTQAKATKK